MLANPLLYIILVLAKFAKYCILMDLLFMQRHFPFSLFIYKMIRILQLCLLKYLRYLNCESSRQFYSLF